MLLIVTYFLSLFSDPYMDGCQENEYGLRLEIAFRGEGHGQVFLGVNHLTYNFHYGFKGGKGNFSYNDINLLYQDHKIKITHKESGKEILNLRCTDEQYEKVRFFLSEVKEGNADYADRRR